MVAFQVLSGCAQLGLEGIISLSEDIQEIADCNVTLWILVHAFIELLKYVSVVRRPLFGVQEIQQGGLTDEFPWIGRKL